MNPIASWSNWRRSKLLILLPCLVLLATTLPHLEQGDFRRDTGRYAAVGLLMWQDGTFFQPRLNPETPYFDKPPLALWIHGFFLKILGVHLTVARFPSVLAALGVVSLSILAARQIGSRAEAVVSGLILASTYEFFRRTREISLDLWQLLFLMAAVFMILRGAKADRKGLVLLAGLPIGLALLCKPLVGLATIPALAVWLWILGRKQWLIVVAVGTVPIALALALPWHLHMWWQYGEPFVAKYFYQETVKRFEGEVSAGPFYYYVRILAHTYWPWALPVAFAVFLRFRKSSVQRVVQRDLVVFGGIWVVYTLAVLALFPSKQINYMVPVFPMLSWVAAAGLCRLPWKPLRAWYRSRFQGLAAFAIVLLIALSVAPIRFQQPPERDWQQVFQWLDRQGIDHRKIAARNLEYDDICYFFLKRGAWLRLDRPTRANERSGSPLEYALSRAAALPSDELRHAAFRSGRFAVLASKEKGEPASNPAPAVRPSSN